jgi:hypothetical protein
MDRKAIQRRRGKGRKGEGEKGGKGERGNIT